MQYWSNAERYYRFFIDSHKYQSDKESSENKKKKMKNNLWKCKSWWEAYYVTSENMKC